MDSLTFYHANADLEEQGVLDDILSLDIEVNIGSKADAVNNSFSVTVGESFWAKQPIMNGHIIYVPDTEWGGIVTNIVHSTKDGTVKVEGATWRGILHQIIIEPPSGQAYVVLSEVDANRAIETALNGKLSGLFVVDSGTAGVNVSANWRYSTVANALNSTFADYGLRLEVVFNSVSGKVMLSAKPVNELTDEVELSQDYGVDFTSKDGRNIIYNHCLALGSGELENRTVMNVYWLDGVYYTEKPSGWDDAEERTIVLDYPNAEDQNNLLKSAKEKLEKFIPVKSISIDQITVDINTRLGDIIGAKDRLIGMEGQSKVVRKILKIGKGTVKIDMGVE